MGIFTGLWRSRDKPKNSYDSPSYTYFFGRANSGKRVTDRTALQHIAVYACVRVLSEAIAQLPLHVYKYNDKGKERVPNHPLYFLLHDQPNPEMTSFVFRETLMSHLLIYGNAYAQIIRNGRGDVIGLYPLMPDKMKVDRDDKNRLIYIYSRYDEANPNMKEQGDIILYADEVLHIPGLGFDGLVGYSPIALAKNAIGISIACEEYGASFFGNGASPSGVLEHPGVIKNPERVRDAWQRAYGGRNAHKVAVLEEGMKFTPIAIPNNEAQFLETRKFQIEEIARLYRVPLHMIGDLDHATFSNVEHLSLDFVKYSLDPWIVRWEQGLMKALLSDSEKGQYFIKFNVDGLLRGDYASRDFAEVRAMGTGRSTVLSQHIIQSFAPGEITSDEALKIGIELCNKFLKGEYQYYLAVHNDKCHIHMHCIFNNTNLIDYRTFETHENQGKKSERSWKKFMNLSDEICKEHGLSVIENAETSKGKSHYEWDMNRQDLSWKAKLKFAIDQVVKESENFDDFLLKCKAFNIEVVYNPHHKIDLKFRLQGQQRFARARTLGWYYETKQIKRRIEMFKGVISYTPKTKIIATDTEKIQGSFGLYKWADLKNKQELSKAINIASQYCISDNQNLEDVLHQKYRNQGVLSEKLNHIKTEIDDLELKIKVAKTVQKYKLLSDESKSLAGHKKAKFDKEHAQELKAFSKAVRQLKEWFPDDNVPTPESMDKKRSTLLQECSDLNKQYSVLKSEIKELNYARQTLDDYFRNERNNQELKKKKDELE